MPDELAVAARRRPIDATMTEMTAVHAERSRPPARQRPTSRRRRCARPRANPRRPTTRVRLHVFRGEAGGPTRYDDFDVPVEEGMVVLDALHWIQGHAAPDLAVRWNCKAAKCGSCGAEVNGKPQAHLQDPAVRLRPVASRSPSSRCGRSRSSATSSPTSPGTTRSTSRSSRFTPPEGVPQSDWRWQQEDIERVQEYRKCIECFLCQDVCHVLRNHETEQPFMGPRFLVRAAGPGDAPDRPGRPPPRTSRTPAASATATSRSAAPRSARSTSRSPTTRSSRSRSASPTSSTTRSSGPGGSSAAAPRTRRSRDPLPVLPTAAARPGRR